MTTVREGSRLRGSQRSSKGWIGMVPGLPSFCPATHPFSRLLPHLPGLSSQNAPPLLYMLSEHIFTKPCSSPKHSAKSFSLARQSVRTIARTYSLLLLLELHTQPGPFRRKPVLP